MKLEKIVTEKGVLFVLDVILKLSLECNFKIISVYVYGIQTKYQSI